MEFAFEVAGTKEIKTWILGFGSLAKVLEPASLVEEIKDDLGKSLKSYGAHGFIEPLNLASH